MPPATKPELSRTEAAALRAALPPGTPDVYREMALALFKPLVRTGTTPQLANARDAAAVAALQVDAMRQLLGGQYVYFPSDRHRAARERAAAIVAEFDGTNKVALARRWRLTVERVGQILRAAEGGSTRKVNRP